MRVTKWSFTFTVSPGDELLATRVWRPAFLSLLTGICGIYAMLVANARDGARVKYKARAAGLTMQSVPESPDCLYAPRALSGSFCPPHILLKPFLMTWSRADLRSFGPPNKATAVSEPPYLYTGDAMLRYDEQIRVPSAVPSLECAEKAATLPLSHPLPVPQLLHLADSSTNFFSFLFLPSPQCWLPKRMCAQTCPRRGGTGSSAALQWSQAGSSGRCLSLPAMSGPSRCVTMHEWIHGVISPSRVTPRPPTPQHTPPAHPAN